MNKVKFVMLGAVAALGLSTVAMAQPKIDHRPKAEASATSREGGSMQGDMSGMMAMMNDSEMRAEMMEMMRDCNKMMKMKQEQMSIGKAG